MDPLSNHQPTPPILVTGGTGTLGRLVVPRLRDAGRTVRVLSRGRRDASERTSAADPGIEAVAADLATGEGVEAALGAIDTVIHLAGTAKGDGDKARHLVEGAARAGVSHLVYISVVGDERVPIDSAIDRAMFGYFGEKRSAEQAIAESGIPWTTLHATQLFDLTLKTAQGLARLPVIPVPAGFRFQPVDAGEVADRLVELALDAPAGLVLDLAGPRIYTLANLVRSYLRAAGKHRLILSMPLPGRAARAIRDGANLAPDRAVGRRTWEDFLAERVGSADDRRVATS
jgi:uncharacterized protein YbjT (DUF2867 family)